MSATERSRLAPRTRRLWPPGVSSREARKGRDRDRTSACWWMSIPGAHWQRGAWRIDSVGLLVPDRCRVPGGAPTTRRGLLRRSHAPEMHVAEFRGLLIGGDEAKPGRSEAVLHGAVETRVGVVHFVCAEHFDLGRVRQRPLRVPSQRSLCNLRCASARSRQRGSVIGLPPRSASSMLLVPDSGRSEAIG
jgi:hypothetical protein